MKKLLTAIVLTLASVSVLADIPPMPRPRPPRIEPGPIQAIKGNAVEAMDALLSVKAADMKKFMEAGNTITAATVQNLRPDLVSYTFARKHCIMGGVVGSKCLGGAQLQVTTETKREGSRIVKTVKSSVILFR